MLKGYAVDLRQLRYFVAVANKGGISAAAQELCIAQPALTRQMQGLEDEIGVPLFDRVPRGVVLTEAGKQLLEDAKRLLDDTVTARERARRAGRGEIGHLSIALPVLQIFAPMVAQALGRYRQQVPDVSISLTHLLSDVQLAGISEGRLDASFLLFRPLDNPTFQGIPIYSEKLLLAYPAHWQWENGKPRSLRDLQSVEFIWLSRSTASMWHDALIHCFYEAGFVPNGTLFGVDAASMLTLVAAGMGCTVMPDSMRRMAPDTVAFLEIPDLNVTLHWELVWNANNRSNALRRFVEVIAGCTESRETFRVDQRCDSQRVASSTQ